VKEVWILNHYAQVPGGSGGTRHFHLAEYLRDFGWNSTIVASSVEHGTGFQRLRANESSRSEEICGVRFLWIKTPSYLGNGLNRLLNIFSYTFRAIMPATTGSLNRPDVVVGSSVHPFAAVSAFVLSRRFRVPFVFEVRDLWPQTLIDLGRLKERSFAVVILRALERWLYRKASRIVVLLPNAHEYIVPLGIERARIFWIPNGVDLRFFGRVVAPIREPGKIFTLMYFGSHGQANGLEELIAAMDYIHRSGFSDRVKLRLIGDGPRKQSLIDDSRRLGLPNVFFEQPVPKNQIPALAAEADAFVIPIPDRPNLYKYGISPNKVFDFLAAGRPILIATTAINNPVLEADAGLSVLPGDARILGEAIIRLTEMPPEELERFGRNGRRYVEDSYGFDKLALKFGKVLDSAVLDGIGANG
jgi:glycosyltransferase involved in cell wall biosynthesis